MALAFWVTVGVAEGFYNVQVLAFVGVDLALLSAFLKGGSTLIKYVFQISLNCQKQSVKGVSIATILLDLCGCLLGLCQVQVDSLIGEYGFLWNDPRLNLAKFSVVLFSIISDVVILVQYYLVYPKHTLKTKLPAN